MSVAPAIYRVCFFYAALPPQGDFTAVVFTIRKDESRKTNLSD